MTDPDTQPRRLAMCPLCNRVLDVDRGSLPLHTTTPDGPQECRGHRIDLDNNGDILTLDADHPDPAAAFLGGADPTIIRREIHGDDGRDVGLALAAGRRALRERIPRRYRNATAQHPQVRAWVAHLIRGAHGRGYARIVEGPSLLLLGPTGTGKTHTAYGAVRALCVSGVWAGWQLVTAADMYAQLRPRPNVSSEETFDNLTKVGLLVIDDLGAAKGTEWNEEINYRLINHRYENERPTLITSNVPPKNLAEALGERVASRLVEMAERVVLKGDDRRLTGPKAVAS